MPGPGGGSRGGGGFGGGFGGGRGGGFGGGRGGGGFGGGFRPRPPHHHYGPRGFFRFRRPFYHGYGGGCLGVLLTPFILILFAGFLLLYVFSGTFGAISQGGVITYNENDFQDYADAEYAKAFSGSTAYEDNILLVVLVTENCDGYCYIAWVGDHIVNDINELFGNETTALGYAMKGSINTASFKYSLDQNLASVVNKMEKNIGVKEQHESFTCEEDHNQVDSRLINYTDLPMTEATVKTALEDFTENTGITMSIVVNNVEDVFEKDYTSMAIAIVFVVILLVIAVFLIYKGFKARRNNQNNNGNNGNSSNRYENDNRNY